MPTPEPTPRDVGCSYAIGLLILFGLTACLLAPFIAAHG